MNTQETLTDESKEPISHLVKRRVPWLTLGLMGGMVASVIVSRYEQILSQDVRLAFFIPIIVYMSDAIGTQTETIYIRQLHTSGIHFRQYLLKESALGAVLGITFGLMLGLFAWIWLEDKTVGLVVGLTIMINATFAPILATIIPSILYKERRDPALGSGPLATIIQDVISLIVYFLIANAILF